MGITRIRKGVKSETTGSAIPKKQQININHERLKEVLADTQEVKQILGEVFVNDEKEIEKIEPVEQEAFELSKELKTFMNTLLHRERWTRDELRKLALEHTIMLDSAIEQINFWCEEEHGDYLLFEEQGRYLVQKSVLER